MVARHPTERAEVIVTITYEDRVVTYKSDQITSFDYSERPAEYPTMVVEAVLPNIAVKKKRKPGKVEIKGSKEQ